MDGVHDIGGMHGFGRVEPEADEPVFHAGWEARMFALSSAVPYAVPYSDDHFRRDMERMDPAAYLAASYYEREVTFRMKKVTDLFQPLVIFGVGIVVGFVAIAQVAAMYSVFSQVK